MNLYLYIAQNNPDAAYEICKKYGYFNVNSIEELANCLQSIVAENGQECLKEILEIHPEKEVILEVFDYKKKVNEVPLEEVLQKIFDKNKPVEKEKSEEKSDCGCMKSADATPSTPSAPSVSVNQTNTYILVGALIVSLAIISMKK